MDFIFFRLKYLIRLLVAAILVQIRISRSDISSLMPVITMPALSVVSVAIFIEANRFDLIPYAATAAVMMSIGQMAFFVAGDIVSDDRNQRTLELVSASPAPYYVLVLGRTLVLSSVGVVGFFEAWTFTRFVFGVHIEIFHPFVFVCTLVITVIAAAATAAATSALLGLARNNRTIQTSISGPLYLISGVLVPVTHLPAPLAGISPVIFLYWSSNLIRGSMMPAPVESAIYSMLILALIAILSFFVGNILVSHMIKELSRKGELSL